MKAVLPGLCLLLLLPGSCLAGQADPTPWLPSESLVGGSQYDSRLDKPVHFWGAGMLLADVFSSVASQTGVKLTFSPAGDENERVPVSLFLNEEHPPSLRAAMVQLSWVLDCNFFCEGSEGQQTYYLMHTSIADGAAARLRREAEERIQPRVRALDQLSSQLHELASALALPRDEAIGLYQGADDLLLLNLLEPARRAAARLVLRYESSVSLLDGGEQDPRIRSARRCHFTSWCHVSVEEQDLQDFERACGVTPDTLVANPDRFWVRLELRDTGEEVHADLRVGADLQARTQYTLAAVGDRRDLEPEEQLTLRRLLGERISEERAAAFLAAERDASAGRLRERQRAQQEAARSLSSDAERRLRVTGVELRPGASHFCWQVQEAVARATGFNIASDALWWHEGPTTDAAESALGTLDMLSTGILRFGELNVPLWQWEDAGSFLRFRAADRGVWRAAMLPRAVLGELDAFLAPYVPENRTDRGGPRVVEVTVPLMPRQLAHLAGNLTDVQFRYGPFVNHEDPTEPSGIVRNAFLRESLGWPWPSLSDLRFCASLSDGQWERLAETGLNSDSLSPEQARLLSDASGESHILDCPVTLTLKRRDCTYEIRYHGDCKLTTEDTWTRLLLHDTLARFPESITVRAELPYCETGEATAGGG